MKKVCLMFAVFVFALAAFARAEKADNFVEADAPAGCNLPVGAAAVKSAPQAAENAPKTRTPAERKKQFKARRKLIKKLVRAYRKAPEAEKPAIKAQLAEVVSQGVDAGISYVKDRITAERANLDNWEAKVKAEEADLPAVKARRVEDLLSGEAQRKYKAAKKARKKQMKEAKRWMK